MSTMTARNISPRMIDDPRKAGGAFIGGSALGVSDPRQPKWLSRSGLLSDMPLFSETQDWLGGGDILPVSDLNWQVRCTADFDNDGNTDIMWRYNGPGGHNCVWFMNGPEWDYTVEFLPVEDLNWQIVGTGDFNNGGTNDILWRYGGPGGYVRLWYTEWSDLQGDDLLAVSDLSWQIVGTGDFNKDGHVDILWRYNGPGGYIRVWYMNGKEVIGGDDIMPVVDPAWQISGVGDYNGDGSPDLVWRYFGPGGFNCIWYMNGTSWLETAELFPVPDLNWKIVSR